MAGFLSAAEITSVTGAFSLHFDTFSVQHQVIIHKKPLESYAVNNAPVYAGYNVTNTANIIYTPVSGAFPCCVSYGVPSNSRFKTEIPVVLREEGVKIKVKEDAKNYIENGQNIRIDLNGESYNSIKGLNLQNYQGLKFFIYTLTRTN